MMLTRIVIAITLAVMSNCVEVKFPTSLKFGSATAAYQVEGAWNVSDKTESIWDNYVHSKPCPIKNNDTGDIACDSYYLWERDIEIAEETNLDYYRVKTWLTINEPLVVCDVTYNTGSFGLPILDDDVFPFICNKNLLLAHAKAWRIYDEQFKPLYHGKVSIANHLIWFEPASEEDTELAELANQFNIGRYSHPIYSKEGGWPPTIQKLIAKNSEAEGYPRSRLPEFTQEEIDFIKGTYDFFGLNHYTARKVRKTLPGEVAEPWYLLHATDLHDCVFEVSDDWTPANSDWFYFYPESIRLLLSWLKNQYGDLEYFITETGISTKTGINDQERIQYIQKQLSQILLTIYEDGVNVTAYTYWSLMDNFEWSSGYSERFGLFEVDFNDPARTRTAKNSAKYYSNIIKNRALDKLYV